MFIPAIMTKVVLVAVFLFSSVCSAEIIFEGYYKVSAENQHIGYYIQRYSLDPQTKLFSSTYYMVLKVGETVTIESLNANATTKFEPHSYQYSKLEGSKSQGIDAIIKGKKLVIKKIDDKKLSAKEIPISDKVFLSTFLPYLILKTPKGMAVGNKFTYDAIAEEDGVVTSGEVYVKEQIKEAGLDTYRALNTFKKEQFVNWVDIKGESIKTFVPAHNLTAELMRNPKDSYNTFPFNEKSVRLLFGNIPEGKTNMIAK